MFLGRVPRSSNDDIAALQAGEVLLVVAFMRQGKRFRRGRLVLNMNGPHQIGWVTRGEFRSYRGGIALTPPFEVESVGFMSGPGSWNYRTSRLRLMKLYAAGRLWEIGTSKIDVELVRTAVSTAARS